MKTIRLLTFALLLTVLPVAFVGCQNTTTTQTTKYKTLAATGLAAQGAVDTAAQLLKSGKITVAQWERVAFFYDAKFQPAFNFARGAAQSDLSTLASPDVTALLVQLTALVAELSTPPVQTK